MSTRSRLQGNRSPSEQADRVQPLLAGLVLLLVASTLNGFTAEASLGAFRLTVRPDQVVLVLLLPLLGLAMLQRRVRWRRTILGWPVLGIVVANAFSSILFSASKRFSLQSTVLLAVYVAMYFVTVNLCIYYVQWLQHLMRIFLGLGLVQAMYGLLAMLAYTLGQPIGGVMLGQAGPGTVSARGTFVEANYLGVYMAIVGLFLSARLLWSDQRIPSWRVALAWLLVSTTLVLTLTRAAWLGFCGGLVVLVLVLAAQTRGWRRIVVRVLPLAAVILAIVGISVWIINPWLSELYGEPNVLLTRAAAFFGYAPAMLQGSDVSIAAYSRGSVDFRFRLYREGLKRWLLKPILGYGTMSGDAPGVYHGWWLGSMVQALHDTGIIGALLLVWMHIAATLCCWLAHRRERDGSRKYMLLASSVSHALLFFASQFSSFLWLGFFWVFMGLTMALVEASRGVSTGIPVEAYR